MNSYGVLGVYSLADDAIFSTVKPGQTVAAEIVKTPTEVLPSKPTPSAVIQSPEVQKERADFTEASHQDMSVAGAGERVSLPPNLTEIQG